MFDPNADPESVAARAAELALEQLDRLRVALKNPNKTNREISVAFYTDPFEIKMANEIAQLMAGYAVLKGYVTEERANGN